MSDSQEKAPTRQLKEWQRIRLEQLFGKDRSKIVEKLIEEGLLEKGKDD